jgi:fatty-acyl-CoA synthase
MLQHLRSRAQRVESLLKDSGLAGGFLWRSGLFSTLSPAKLAAFVKEARQLKPGPHLALLLHAHIRPDQEALVCGKRRLNYRELNASVNRLARALTELGFSPGDTIGMMLPNCVEHVVAQETMPRIGGVSVQIGYRLKAGEIAHILDNSEPQVLIYHYAYESEIRGAVKETGLLDESQLLVVDAPPGVEVYGSRYEEFVGNQDSSLPPLRGAGGGGVIIYTSGTTGKPKGATRSWKDTGILSVIDMMSQVGMSSSDRHIVVCPLYHSGAMAFAKMQLILGATVVLMDHFDAEETLAAIQAERITSAFMVPTMLVRINSLAPEVRARYDVSSLRWIMSGAAPLATETARRFQELYGPILYNFYGATETGTVTIALPDDHVARSGTVGRPLRGNAVRVLDDDQCELPPGEVGELYVKNDMIITGYHKNDEATRKSVVDGFFSVGDLARVDADGYLYLASRKHDMVISGGVNIYPREIEEHLHRHPDILEAAVIGVPDEEWGESLKAFIVKGPGSALSESEVMSHCKDGLAGYKRPKQVVFMDNLPRNPTGKVLKRELREL